MPHRCALSTPLPHYSVQKLVRSTSNPLRKLQRQRGSEAPQTPRIPSHFSPLTLAIALLQAADYGLLSYNEITQFSYLEQTTQGRTELVAATGRDPYTPPSPYTGDDNNMSTNATGAFYRSA